MRDRVSGPPTPTTACWGWAFAGLIPVAVGMLFHRALGMWWTADDPMVLWQVFRFGPADYFFNPAVWRSFNSASLTPWMLLSFDVDCWVIGLEPAGFYLHQLVALTVAVVALWVCLRLFLSPAGAGLGALVLLAAPATTEIASNLSTRHYVEGLVLACLSFVFFVMSLRKSGSGLNLLATAFFVLALTAKEIFAPLPVVLLLLPEGDLRRRLRKLAPFAVVLTAYLAWRRWMLGSLSGGYRARLLPSAAEISAWLRSSAEGVGLPVAVLVIGLAAVLVGGAVAVAACRPAWRWFWLGFAACVALPLLPVLHVYSPRHAFAVAVLVAAVVAALADRLIRDHLGTLGRWSVGAFGVGLLAAAALTALSRLPTVDQVQRVRAEGEEVLRGDGPDRVVVSPLMPYWHFYGLLHLRSDVLGLPPGPAVVSDLCLSDALPREGRPVVCQLLVFDPASGKLVEMPEPVEPCRLIGDAALEVEIRFNPATNLTSWRLGPYHDGRYTVLWVIADGSLVGIDVPPAGDWRGNVAFEMGVDLVVTYRSPNGWRTVTPRLAAMPTSGGITIDWSREPAPLDHSPALQGAD